MSFILLPWHAAILCQRVHAIRFSLHYHMRAAAERRRLWRLMLRAPCCYCHVIVSIIYCIETGVAAFLFDAIDISYFADWWCCCRCHYSYCWPLRYYAAFHIAIIVAATHYFFSSIHAFDYLAMHIVVIAATDYWLPRLSHYFRHAFRYIRHYWYDVVAAMLRYFAD